MNVVLSSLLLIFGLIQKAAQVSFMLFLNILKINLNILKGKLVISYLFELFLVYICIILLEYHSAKSHD